MNSDKNVIEQIFLIFCFLPYEALLMVDAILRTLYRVLVSKKNLLEWQTAADVEANSKKSFRGYYIFICGIGSIIAIIIGLLAFNRETFQ